jgi:hypothetical protein
VTVTNTAFSYNMLCESLDLVATPLEHSHFETAFIADVNMERRLREMVVIVEFPR